MQRRSPWIALAAVFVMLAATMITSAQSTAGLITGVVSDPSGASVVGATVVVQNGETGLTRTTTTDTSGIYTVPQLPPGMYAVLAKHAGFALEKRPNVRLEVNENATIKFQLTVVSTNETITVTDAPPPLNTTSATLGEVINHSATVDLPLNGREFTQLALLTPGASPVESGQQKQFTVALGEGGVSPAVNGQRGQQDNFTMDGVLNNNTYTDTWAISPPPDALQEFNVQSHITDAQFAISSGANINIVTRSGTKDFHGSVWEFLRNARFTNQPQRLAR
jgi:Carboxypeptidase regulatory-like domain